MVITDFAPLDVIWPHMSGLTFNAIHPSFHPSILSDVALQGNGSYVGTATKVPKRNSRPLERPFESLRAIRSDDKQ
jgi:hypothetical protein